MSGNSLTPAKRRHWKRLLWEAQNGACAHCGEALIHPELAVQAAQADPMARYPNYPSFDRVHPGARGGRYTLSNLLLACQDCNERRGDEYGLTQRAWRMHRQVQAWLKARQYIGELA